MSFFRRVAAASLMVALAASSAAATSASPTTLVGWASGPALTDELRYEHLLMGVPSAGNALRIETTLSSQPHRAGTPADIATAKFVQARLEHDGFTTHVVKYNVWFTGPTDEHLDLVRPKRVAFDLIEGTPGHHSKWETLAGWPFMENSGDGDVRGPLYYVNTASEDDLAMLDAMHVNLRDAIVLIRYAAGGGGAARPFNPAFNSYNELRKRGVVGILAFYDPAGDGFGRGATWPDGNYKNAGMAERIAGGPGPSSPSRPPGDPTLPGQAPIPGIAHLPWSQVAHATIPELSITQRVARELLAGMTGKVAPGDWHPMYEFVQHVGGNQIVHERAMMTRHLTTIWNVIGDIKGTEQPNSVVVIGSHRDAMAFGAIDPGSGTTVLLQDADAFHALVQNGWRPKRTLRIASWDGHELGLYGSVSYAYQYGAELHNTVMQYINTDQLTTGDPFIVSASPGLWAFMKQIADVVPGPDGKALSARDQGPGTRPLLNPITGGSDHQTFAYELGVPSTTNGYYGPFGAHHTAEDNLDGLRTYDPGMKEAVACAQLTGIQAMRALGATVSPIRIAEQPQQMLKDLPPLYALTAGTVDLAPLYSAVKAYLTTAKTTDAAMAQAEANGDAATMQTLGAKIHASRAAFYLPDGLTFNKYYHTIDRVVRPYPEIFYAGSDPKALQTAVDRMIAAVTSATTALQ